jgi:hypothetical protein
MQPLAAPRAAGRKRLTRGDVADLARGCAFLGSGGGGDTHVAVMEIESLLGAGDSVELLDPEALDDDTFVAGCGWIGAPTVELEKVPSGREALQGLRKLEEIAGRAVGALFPIEIGGANGLAPLALALRSGLPVVDCDGMGRAFPESQMVIFNIRGQQAVPAILTDSKGNCVIIDSADNLSEERLARALSVAMGGVCHLIEYSADGRLIRRNALHGTITEALAIGRSLRLAREGGEDPFAGLFSALRGCRQYGHAGFLFEGKIVDLQRETRGGFAVGRAVIAGFVGGGRMEVEFKNENLLARLDGRVRALVPDIISILDRETADTIVTERLRYGQRVAVIGASAPPALRTPESLAVLGPAAFRVPDPYLPVEELNDWCG